MILDVGQSTDPAIKHGCKLNSQRSRLITYCKMTSAINAGYTSNLYMNFLHQQFNEIIHFSYRYLIDYVMKNKLISISNNAIDKHNNCCITNMIDIWIRDY